MDLDNGKTDHWQLIREVCPDVEWKGENQGPKQICPKIEGVFFYAMNVSGKGVVNSSLGVLTKDGEAKTWIWGSYWRSGKELKPYYAACGKAGGNDERPLPKVSVSICELLAAFFPLENTIYIYALKIFFLIYDLDK